MVKLGRRLPRVPRPGTIVKPAESSSSRDARALPECSKCYAGAFRSQDIHHNSRRSASRTKTVDEPVGRDSGSSFVTREWTAATGQPSITRFVPAMQTEAYTLAQAYMVTGRRHQIRVHAAHLGHLVGDKLYSPDQNLMPRFIAEGFTPEMVAQLKLERQTRRAHQISFPAAMPGEVFTAPLPSEMVDFWKMLEAFSNSFCLLPFESGVNFLRSPEFLTRSPP
jgi:hypothetical protein